MKKILILIMLVMSLNLFGLSEDIVFANSNSIQLRMSQANDNIIQKTFAFPSSTVNVTINSMTTETVNSEGEVISQDSSIDYSRVIETNSFIMRELNGFTFNIVMNKNVGENISVIKNIDFEVSAGNEQNIPSTISEAFLPIYKEMVDNFESSYLADRELSRGNMLIICHEPALEFIEDFVIWKKAKGFDVDVQTIQTIGTSYLTIKEYIANYYNENHPDFVVLMGDVDGTYEIPATYIVSSETGENDITDHNYTLIEGDDYFPELLIGRISVDSPMQLVTVLNKTINYEKNPSMSNTDWMEKALLVAGNFSDSGAHPITPVWTSIWLQNKMLNQGYTQVDTVFSWAGSQYGAVQIQSALNSGVQYVGYRGWGDANGWHYPYFHIPELDATNSFNKNPVVMSIVCNSGDFGNTTVDPCFGEKWLRMGTPNTPNGCVAFVGPSDLHTHTYQNNAIYAGIFSSIMDEGVRTFGTAVLRGKFEVYKSFPHEVEEGGQAEFWYHIYNVLGDPSLNLWKLIPQNISCELPESVNQSTSFIEVNLPNYEGAIISATKDEENYAYSKVINGNAIVQIDPEQVGDIIITIVKNNHVPFVATIPVNGESGIGMTNYSVNGEELISAETIGLDVELKNFSDEDESGILATLSCDSEYFVAPTNPTNIGTIASQGTATAHFEFNFDAGIENNSLVNLTIDLSSGDEIKIELPVRGFQISVLSCTSSGLNYLPMGDNVQIDVTINNSGYIDVEGLTAEVLSANSAVSNISNVNFGDLAFSESATATFSADIASDAYIGSIVRFSFLFEDSEGRSNQRYFSLPIGEVDNTSVTIPPYSSYPYYAYDSNDVDYEEHPTYEWIEIDPQYGGDGEFFIVGDDEQNTVDLPFTFKFYGIDYDQITICSNGYLAFGNTWAEEFKNWNIPMSLGPSAMIAAFWDDLKGEEVPPNSDEFEDMRNCYKYDEANNRFIIEWSDTYSQHDGSTLEKFEVILTPVDNDDGDIEIMYHTIDDVDYDGNFSTVGIENQSQDDGLLYVFSNIYPASASPLENGLAIKFTKVRPDDYVGNNSDSSAPSVAKLYQNYPNPFNPTTTISFSLAGNTNNAEITIYNIKGQKVRNIVSKQLSDGRHSVVWNGKDDSGYKVGSGVYFYKLSTNNNSIIKKMILLK
ncbi:MAG: C25 family cysteine peptidase [Candidatus Cloacimonadota bacterium]|nr:C25 family cysteine peptidase [Candidatus Cloacimonadota bacterium]